MDDRLYETVKRAAKRKFKRYPSIYASSWIVAEYKRRGGKYPSKKKPRGTGLDSWYAEKWIQVIPYLTSNRIIQCGAQNKDGKACRPLHRISSSTPRTLPELLKMHSRAALIRLAKKKEKDMRGRVAWVAGTFKPSKR